MSAPPASDRWDLLAESYHRFALIMRRVNPSTAGWIRAQLGLWANAQPDERRLRGIDVGCGSGVYTLLLGQYCDTVTGFDVSPRMVQLALQYSYAEHIAYVQGNPVLGTDRSDVVMSTYAAHHMGDIEDAYARFRDLVLPGGAVIVVDVVANPDDWCELDWHVRRAEQARQRALDATQSTYQADQVYATMTDPAWLDCVMADTPPSEMLLRAVVAELMPGANVVPLAADVWGMVWIAPQ